MLEGVPDYRKGNAIRHKLSDILMIGLLTIICNGNDYMAMTLFGETHESVLREFLELPHGIPSEDTFERVFTRLNPRALAAVFLDWIQELKGIINVGIDGKTIRRSRSKGKKAKHIVSAFASELQLVLGQLATDEKSNEITAIPELLDMFCRKDMIITIDAMGTQTDIAEKIIEKEADYILALKGNQETLHEDVSMFLKNEVMTQDKQILRDKCLYEKTVEKDHGRIETRECFIWPHTDWLYGAEKWAGLSGVGVIVSKREEIGKEPTTSHNFFIFSLKNTSAAELLRIKRAHWAVENNLHWMLDVAFREDDARARLGDSAENLNILRKQALQLMKSETSVNGSLRAKRLRCAYDLSYALKVIGVN
jgi:predicted transposase YbfD/YdcC